MTTQIRKAFETGSNAKTRRRGDAKGHLIRSAFQSILFAALQLCVFALSFFFTCQAQRIAIIAPDRSDQGITFTEHLANSLDTKFQVLDRDMALAAFGSGSLASPFNMSVEEAKLVSLRVGCEFLVLVRADVLRRSSFTRPEYYEAYATLFIVSRRTGRLVDWRLLTFNAARPEAAWKLLDGSVERTAKEIGELLPVVLRRELAEPKPPLLPEPPDEKLAPDPAFRSPLPYRRLKPEYTTQANLYGVTATVEITVDLDAAGEITRTEITRWAGFGLDEAVEKAVRTMNWRPADRRGQPLGMRFTLQYNFKKVEKS